MNDRIVPRSLLLGPLFLGWIALSASCAPSGPAASPTAGANEDFARLVDEYFDQKFAFEPSSATAAGLHDRDGLLEERSAARLKSRVEELKRLQARFEKIDRSRLSFDEAIDAELLSLQVDAELLDIETLRLWEINPMPYASLPGQAVDGIMKRAFAPPTDRLRLVVKRLDTVPYLYEAAKQNLKNPPHEFTDLAIRMSKGSVGFFERSVATWARDIAPGDAPVHAAFDRANAKAAEATRAFATWLQNDLLPRSHGSYAIGTENFRKKLRFEEMVDEPLDSLLARGQAQLDKDRAAFVETARSIDSRATAAEVMTRLSEDHPTAEDLIPSVARSLEATRQFLIAHDIVTVPSEVRPRVEETPPYARSGGFASMDTPGPYETRATEAFYYVTPVEADWDARHREEHLRGFNRTVLAVVDVHEAYPGHYLQFLYAPKFPTKVRKLVAVGTNAEGWAHYAEQMMIDEGFGNGDPKVHLAQLEEALLRDCRYVVGIKLHTQGMTVEQGARVFVEQCFLEPANAYEEARRGAYNPTYLYYTLGKLEIQKLRDEYRTAHPGSTLKAFHDAFVAQGSVPIPLARRLLLRK